MSFCLVILFIKFMYIFKDCRKTFDEKGNKNKSQRTVDQYVAKYNSQKQK